MNKPYELGILIGRFQPFHTGHQDMIDKALALCDKVGLFIGSSQESGTLMNPFSYEERKGWLKKIYGDRLYVYPLPDIGVGNNSKWGDYVIENVIQRFGRAPDLFVSGKESRRIDWFDSINGLAVAELYLPKTIEISATRVREMFIGNELEEWKKYTDPLLWDEFDRLRKTVISSSSRLDTASI